MVFKIYYVTLIITFAFGLYTFKGLDKNLKWFVRYLAFAVVYESLSLWDLLLWHNTDSWCMNFEEMIEFCLFTFYMASIVKKANYKRKVYIGAAIVLLFAFINMFFIQGLWKLNTISEILYCLFILTLVCIYYYNLFDEAEEGLMLLKHAPFLVATGSLFYITAKFFYYSCFSFMVYKNNYNFYILAATIPGIANMLLNILLITAFLCSFKTNKLSL